MPHRHLSNIIKAYDVGGLVGADLYDDFVRQVGAAFVRLVDTTVAIVHDMRRSSRQFAAAFSEGVGSQGKNVINVGLGSTDLVKASLA
ncbi:hypothetical protein [Nocardia sp. NPDC052112]|uniref:hypothetical protein n=1 Tax=Nocardia sp. NPDC052112 TaxID=3155646 RepID=UPI003433BA2B